jgi:hypothetical protein
MVAIVGTSYSVVVMAHTITQYASNLSQLGPRGAMIRRYLFVHALRLKFRRFRWDLIQIAFLAILLGYLVGLHKSLRVFEL